MSILDEIRLSTEPQLVFEGQRKRELVKEIEPAFLNKGEHARFRAATRIRLERTDTDARYGTAKVWNWFVE